MKILIDHPDRGGRTTHGSRLDRLSVVAGWVVLLCLIPGLVALSQVVTTTEITFGLTIDGTFTPLSLLPSDPVVGQEVTVVWKVTAPTTLGVSDWDDVDLSRQLESPDPLLPWDLLDGTVAPDEGENDENWIKWTYKFTPEVAGTYTAEGSYPDCDDCTPPLAGSLSGSVTVNVDKANTTTSLSLDPAPSVTGQSVTLTATVAPSIPSPVGLRPDVTGTLTFSVGATFLGSAVLDLTGKAELTTSSIPVGTQTITAQYEGDAGYNASSGTEDQTVGKADTELTLATAPSPSGAGQPVTLTADVETVSPGGGSPTGTVTFTVGATFLGSAGLVSTGANASQAEITTSLIPAGAQIITAEYGGDTDYNDDDDTEDHTVTKSSTTTIVFGSDTPLVVGDTVTCTVTVEGTSPGDTSMPTEMVNVTVDPSDEGTPVSWSKTLNAADAGQFTFTYTPSSAASATHTFTATYAGDDAHGGSSGSFAQAIIKRAADVRLACSPTTAYIFQEVSCQVNVEDDTTAGTPVIPTGTVTFSDDGKAGVFTVGGVTDPVDTWDLSGGALDVEYTPGAGDAGTTTITAIYNGSSAHSAKSTTQLLTVNLRPTQTQVLGSMTMLLVNEMFEDGTVEVTDIAGVGTSTLPSGTLAYSSSLLPGDATVTSTGGPPLSAPSDTYTYQCHGLGAAAGYDTVRVDYAATDGIHANSAGAFGQGVQRRPTVTTLSGCASTATGCTCNAHVAEHPDCVGHGGSVAIGGTLAPLDPGDTETVITGSAPDWEVTTYTDAFVAIVSVGFTATDRVHLNSSALESVSRSDQFPPEPDDGSTGAGCDDGCGSGGRNVDEILMGINSAELALTMVQMGLEVFATVLDVIPDVVTGGGVFVIVGVTIPISDIVAAVVSGAGIAIDIAVTTMTTDIDGDGLPGVVEMTLGTSDIKVDSDGDGMGDADEISEAGGWCGGSRRPNPLVKDSDGDGLEDGEEGSYGTSVCVADTDCDGVSDGVEVGTWDFTEIRSHADPLMQDTDGDGLRDDLEIDAGCPYVSDDDSDDDGLQDGYEDSNRDGTISNTIGTSLTQGSGETDFCRADTDGDGLLDGQEEGVFGTSVTPKGVSSIVGTQGGDLGVTVPALDSDMDNDGLSDEAETNTYQTDPMDADTDNDMISDGAEVATWANADSRNHSNPREDDTDGDGLTDNLEIALGCPYVNDDDSDDDGLQDGIEDANRNGVWDSLSPGDSTTQKPTGETNICDPDTDDDGLTDGEEVSLFGGLPVAGALPYYLKAVPTTAGDTIPALDDDSDNDGLSDYEEVNITGTDPLDRDTDGDTISDANELIAVSGLFGHRTFIQVSDPLDPDTDDDGLTDEVEWTVGHTYHGTGLGDPSSTYFRKIGGNPDTICPYVNDDDSDDDGLQDGYEDKNQNGIWDNYSLGTSSSAGSGETCACHQDSDRDGLSDGEEEGLLGRTATPQGASAAFGVAGAAGLATVPALDDDSDNDGLSDYEEANVTHTDPLDYDTDDDTLGDANELIATGWLVLNPGYSLTFVPREFQQESDPLDPDTDDDDLYDYIEYPGTQLGSTYLRILGGVRDIICPYVNDDDSDDDGLQDGTEDSNHDGTWGVNGSGITCGNWATQSGKTVDSWETDLCNPDTDGDGLLDGEEVQLLGGGPILGRPRPLAGFYTVTPEAASSFLPVGSTAVPAGYAHPSPIPGTNGDLIAPYAFVPVAGDPLANTIPALDSDSDNDGLSDYEEVNVTSTDPLDQDSDNDTLKDADELIATGGAWPNRTFDQESDPLDINTDDDHLFDPQEYAGSGLSARNGLLGGARDNDCPYVNDDDSDNDGIQDGAVVVIAPAVTVTGTGAAYNYSYTHYEDFVDLDGSSLPFPGQAQADVGEFNGEQRDDSLWNVCDPDSDGDGLNDGEEIAIGTNPDDCDTDDDGRNDWHEVTGGGPIPTDPFDPDTDDDGLLDSAEVFGSNPTNPVNADTDGDGLCDGGAGTPWMTSGDLRVIVNPVCKSCSAPGLFDCGTASVRTGSPDGIGDHPNRFGFGEDQNGNGAWDSGETDPNQYDTDGDAIADGVERLAFSTSRQYMIPPEDLLGRPILVTYPEANNVNLDCGCLDPLNADSDGDGLSDGYEDVNHDGNFDFLPSDFDIDTSSVETSLPDPEETNPCAADTDGDSLTDWEERFQRQPLAFNPPLPVDNDGDGLIDEDPIDGIDNDGDGLIDEDPAEGPIELTFNPTNPLDWDTDNDWLNDGQEVHWPCVATEYTTLDNDSDGYIDEDPVDGLDNDGDGLIDEDPVDFWVRFVPMLDPTNRDSDSDGFIDGLDEDPCNSEMIPLIEPAVLEPVDSDGDGFSDDDEIAAGTHPNDPEDHPTAYGTVDVDFDECIDDRIWLEPGACCGEAGWVVVDLDNNILIDLRIAITSKSVKHGDFDKDGYEDDVRYTVEYVLSDYRAVQLRGIATIDDYNSDLVIDRVVVERK